MAREAAGSRRPWDRHDRSEHEIEFARIVAFSDGVLAIAITLLVLNLNVPQVSSADASGLADGLLDLRPHLFAYAISFAVVGRFWLMHHRFFGSLESVDARLMAANLLYLALIVLVPFSSDLLGTYGENATAVMVYAAIIGLAGLVNWLMVRYALRRDLTRAEARSSSEPFGSIAALGVAGAFFVSIPVALLSPVAAQFTWLLAILSVRRQRRLGSR